MDVEEGPLIAWFADTAARDPATVGGKGANLASCAQAGLPVPPGFCLTTSAYRTAVRSLHRAATTADDLRDLILGAPLPGSVEDAVRTAYARLGESLVAVRSSATAEELAEASFAGQQDTFLGVTGIEAVLDAVRGCWASLWNERAVDYRRRHGVPETDVALAVVVQALIPADTAGVLFTREPVSGRADTMMASASYGLGESVVAALVTPDTFSLTRDGVPVSSQIGSKHTRVDAAPGGGTCTSVVPTAHRVRPSISAAQLRALAGLGVRVEEHYGRPQDIEWAFSQGNLFLLQARPITVAASPTPGHAPVRGRIERVLLDDLVEHFPAPFPLDLCAVHAVQGAVQDLMTAAGARAVPATSLVRGDDDGVIRAEVARPRLSPALLIRVPRLLRGGMSQGPVQWRAAAAAQRTRLEELTRRADRVASAEDAAVLGLLRDAVAEASAVTADRFVRYNAPMMVSRATAAWLIGLSRSAGITPEDLYAGVPYTTAVIAAGIARLAERARTTGAAEVILQAAPGGVGEALARSAAGADFLPAVAAFLTDHGARTARLYLPFSNLSWREQPEELYTLVAATLRGSSSTRPDAPDAVALVASRLPAALRARWRATAARIQALHIGREATVYLIEELFCVARAGRDEAARRLVARGQLPAPDDLRLLYLGEVEAALTDHGRPLGELVERRRSRRGVAEAIWWDRGQPQEDSEGVLHGQPASAGQARGPARVIHSPAQFSRLQPGDVLVCPYTDPTWTPLFALASAVVADSGGPLSHAAIVAREYGIPAVLGTGSATRLPDGASLFVDGTRGIVTLEPSHQDAARQDNPR